MSSPKEQVEFVTRLAYNLNGLSGTLKLYFSQFLSFYFSGKLSLDQVQHIENKKASRPFASDAEMVQAAANFTTEEKVWVIAALLILKSKAEAIDDRVFSIKTDAVIKNLTGLFGLKAEEHQVLAEKQRLEAEAFRFQNRKLIDVPVSIGPLFLDYALRWGVLLYFTVYGAGENILVSSNVFFIPVLILFLTYWQGKRIERYNVRLLESYGGESNFRLDYRLSTTQYTWLAFFLATGVFIAYLLPDQLHLFALIGLSIYYIVYIRFFLVGRIDENQFVRQLEGEEQNLATLNRDENDEVIVDLETKLNSLTGRLEAYVLESALFGALAFSGFLQIMSSELVTFKALEQFAAAVFDSSRAIMSMDEAGFRTAVATLDTKVTLFCVVSLETLVCSVFFLAVIASRLRFSNVADKVRTAINLAKVYNEKEEALFDEDGASEKKSARLVILNAKVNEQLQCTVDAMREVEPVMTYMQYFRNAGILVFLLILITSTLFITSAVGWAFLGLVLATYLYFNWQGITLALSVAYLNLRIQFSRKNGWLLALAVCPFLIGLVLRDVIFWAYGGIFYTIGFLSVGLYVFFWLLVSAHVDDEFGDIEKKTDEQRISRWKIVKNLLAGLILFCFTAVAMKQVSFTGANPLFFISLSALSFLLYFVGYYLSKIRWLGVVSGGLLAMFSIGVLFKTLHLDGAREMLLIGVVTLALLFPIIIWQRKKFHILFLRFCVVAFLIGVISFSGILGRLEIALSHRTLKTEPIMQVVEDKLEDDLAVTIEGCDWYIRTYGTSAGYPNVYGEAMRHYRYYCRELVLGSEDSRDSTTLQNALLVSRQSKKIQALFGYNTNLFPMEDVEMESDVLLAMNKKEEAIQSLRDILGKNPPPDVVRALSLRIKSIENSK